jgi:hypothetical protein
MIVQPAALLKLLREKALLLFGWIETIFERLQHVRVVASSRRVVKPEGYSSAARKAGLLVLIDKRSPVYHTPLQEI